MFNAACSLGPCRPAVTSAVTSCPCGVPSPQLIFYAHCADFSTRTVHQCIRNDSFTMSSSSAPRSLDIKAASIVRGVVEESKPFARVHGAGHFELLDAVEVDAAQAFAGVAAGSGKTSTIERRDDDSNKVESSRSACSRSLRRKLRFGERRWRSQKIQHFPEFRRRRRARCHSQTCCSRRPCRHGPGEAKSASADEGACEKAELEDRCRQHAAHQAPARRRRCQPGEACSSRRSGGRALAADVARAREREGGCGSSERGGCRHGAAWGLWWRTGTTLFASSRSRRSRCGAPISQ